MCPDKCTGGTLIDLPNSVRWNPLIEMSGDVILAEVCQLRRQVCTSQRITVYFQGTTKIFWVGGYTKSSQSNNASATYPHHFNHYSQLLKKRVGHHWNTISASREWKGIFIWRSSTMKMLRNPLNWKETRVRKRSTKKGG